jgi:hypothetical protein
MQDWLVLRLRGKQLDAEDRPAAYREDDEAWEESSAPRRPVGSRPRLGRPVQRGLPADYPFVNDVVTKKDAATSSTAAPTLPALAGRRGPRRDEGPRLPLRHPAGVTVAIEDVETPREGRDPRRARGARRKIEKQFASASSPTTSAQELIEIWTEATTRSPTRWRRTSTTNPSS